MWSAPPGPHRQLYEFKVAGDGAATAVAYHPVRYEVAVGYEGGSVRVFDVATAHLLHDARRLAGPVAGLAFGCGGARLAAWGGGGAVAVADAARVRAPRRVGGGFRGNAGHAATSAGPRLQSLLAVINQGAARGWSGDRPRAFHRPHPQAYHLLATLLGPDPCAPPGAAAHPPAAALSPDGALLVVSAPATRRGLPPQRPPAGGRLVGAKPAGGAWQHDETLGATAADGGGSGAAAAAVAAAQSEALAEDQRCCLVVHDLETLSQRLVVETRVAGFGRWGCAAGGRAGG